MKTTPIVPTSRELMLSPLPRPLLLLLQLWLPLVLSNSSMTNAKCSFLAGNNEMCSYPNFRLHSGADAAYEARYQECQNISSWDINLTSAPVANLRVVTTSLSPPDNRSSTTSCSNLSVSWQLPRDIASDRVFSFEIRITSAVNLSRPASATCVWCIRYSIKRNPVDNTEFHYSLAIPVAHYLVQVFSLSADYVTGSRYLVPSSLVGVVQKKGDTTNELRNNAKEWSVDMVLQNNSCEKSITMCFQLAPTSFKIVVYKILLRNAIDGWSYRPQITYIYSNTSGSHECVTFTDVKPGSYCVGIDPFLHDIQSDKNYYENDLHISVYSSIISIIHNVTDKADCELHWPPAVSEYQMIAIIIGSIAGLLILFIIGLMYSCHRWWPGWPFSTQNTVLIVYDQDNDAHGKTVRRLYDFLKNQCSLTVKADFACHEDMEMGISTFVINSISNSDKILVIISDGLRSKWRAMDSRHPYPGDADNNDRLTFCLLNCLRQAMVHGDRNQSYIHHKLVTVRFDYTERDSSIDSAISFHAPVHVLMNSINEVVTILHDGKKPHRFTRCFPKFYNLVYSECREGRALEEAIQTFRQTAEGSGHLNEGLMPGDIVDPSIESGYSSGRHSSNQPQEHEPLLYLNYNSDRYPSNQPPEHEQLIYLEDWTQIYEAIARLNMIYDNS